MIIAFVGTPGAGKSYDAVREIINNLRSGRRVYTNVEGMDNPECQRYMQDYLGLDDYEFRSRFFWISDDDIEHFWDLMEHPLDDTSFPVALPLVKAGSLLVIDEIHKRFSNRDWNTEKNKLFADWCSTHRHYGFDVYFITQDMNKVEKHVRSLIEWSYVYRKVNFLGGLTKNGYIKYCYSGDDTSGKALNTVFSKYQIPIFRCYKSMVNDQNVKLNIMPQANILKHPIFYAIPLLVCFFLYLFFTKSSFATGDIFGTSKMVHRNDKKAVVQKPYSAVRAPLVSPVLNPPVQNEVASYGNFSSIGKHELLASASVTVKGIIQDGANYFYLLSDGRTVPSRVKYALNSTFK